MGIGKSDRSYGNRDTSSAPGHQPEVCLVEYPGAQAAAVLGMTDLFAIADRFACALPGHASQKIRISKAAFSGDGRRIERIESSDSCPTGVPDFVVIPPSFVDPLTAVYDRALFDWLVNQHVAGAVLASVCSGGFLLAATGLLDRRTVTVHPIYAASFSARFPRVVVDTTRVVVNDGDVITSAGMLSWSSVGMIIIQRLLGRPVMQNTARYFHLPGSMSVSPAEHLFEPPVGHGDATILRVQQWLGRVGTRDVTNAAMAARAGLQVRTFQRRFRRATGMAPTEYCQHLRVAEAQTLLECTTEPVDAIAWSVGYRDPGSFRKVFRRVTGLTPGDYRRGTLSHPEG